LSKGEIEFFNEDQPSLEGKICMHHQLIGSEGPFECQPKIVVVVALHHYNHAILSNLIQPLAISLTTSAVAAIKRLLTT